MTAQTPTRRPTSEIVDIEYHRADAVTLRNQHTCNLMRGATVTTWALVTGTILLLAVIAIAPRNSVNPRVAASGAPVAIALSSR
jgi:hypothetical protein